VTLFEQGLADPRGCEYREVRLTVGKISLFNQTGETATMTTHAWVLPAESGERQRYAVCWSGLVCPVESVGDKADLAADVRTSIRHAKGDDRDEMFVGWPAGAVGRSIWYRNLTRFSACLLLRAGEGELASRLWEADSPGKREEEPADPYPDLAAIWMRNYLDVAFDAHRHGEDARALHAFRRLVGLAKKVEDAAKARGFEPGLEGGRLLESFNLLPALLADQERRAWEKRREQFVCLGPGRIADQKKRIAALVTRLDEVTGGPSSGTDLIVRALVREGEAAVAPLLDCLEKDDRLTRQISDPLNPYWVEPVHEAAFSALYEILRRQGVPVPETDRERPDWRKVLADATRTCLRQAPGVPPAGRWLRVLADGGAGEARWREAAEALFKADEPNGGVAITWDVRSDRAITRLALPPKRPAEQFRGRKNPSVTELLCKRIEQSRAQDTVLDLAGRLAAWDPAAARPVLAGLTGRVREKPDPRGYRQLISARLKIGDKRALDDYADWLRTTPLSVMELDGFGETFRPMWENPDHPGMAAAAEALFGEDGTWVPFWPLSGVGKPSLHVVLGALVRPPLLRIEPFRRAVQAGLREKSRAGFAKVGDRGDMLVDWGGRGYHVSVFPVRIDPGASREELKSDFRVCDFIAWLVADHIDAAPRCELYWPEARRQAAVEACARFLDLYAGRLADTEGGIAFPVRDRPAGQEEVRKGLAIFSLAGEGESRVVRLPSLPLEARWTTLKDFPFKSFDVPRSDFVFAPRTGFLQEGRVWQAEEVFKGGKWCRYYGFTGCHRIARVPAEEIEFPARGDGWIKLAGGLDGRLLVPPLPVDPDEDGDPRFASDSPLRFTLSLRNYTGLDRRVTGVPPGMRLRLWQSPETVSRKGALEPSARREAEWTEVPAKPGYRFGGGAGQTLGPAAELIAGTIDLRDCFDLGKPGFYRLRLTHDGADADKEREASAEIRFSLAPETGKETR
jgi:hypothetical protein